MKYTTIILALTMLLACSCVKEAYDLDRLSKKAEVSPVFVFPVFKGTVVLSDAIKESDTVVFDDDKFVRLIYRKDSVIYFDLKDYIDIENLVTFSDSYTIGDVMIDPIRGSMTLTAADVNTSQTRSFTPFQNFEYAVFSSGFIDISVTNNFTAPLNNLEIILSNSNGTIGSLTIPVLNPGQTGVESLDLSGKTFGSSLSGRILLSGNYSGEPPASNIAVTAVGRDLKVSSGRVIVPSQTVSDPGSIHTVVFDPGDGIELDNLRIISGTLNWSAAFNGNLNATLNILLPTVTRNSAAVSEIISVTRAGSHGSLSLPNTTAGFNVVAEVPFNRIPVEYSLSVSSNNTLVDFNSNEQVHVDLKLTNAEFDYIKGYFGKHVETYKREPIDFGIEEYLRNIKGTVSLKDPSIRINYFNSFAVPIGVKFDGQGNKLNQTVDLGFQPFIVSYPSSPAERDISATLAITKANSNLSQLISLLPESIVFSGSAGLNPGGDPDHLRNNYVFGNSRLLASAEIELPLELSLNNLQLSDTTENYLQDESPDGDQVYDDLELARLGFNIKNGFPFDVELKVSLYDSAKKVVESTINATGLIKAAKVDASGRVNNITESVATIEVTKDFLDKIDKSDQLIFNFKASTTEAKLVKIYSDYRIDFSINAHLVTKIGL